MDIGFWLVTVTIHFTFEIPLEFLNPTLNIVDIIILILRETVLTTVTLTLPLVLLTPILLLLTI